ncbi:MAG: 2-succinyl-5-enolpyruvyl-6-hydroxy-3-cyclohexene-1-carboxylic-acid synthase [Ignavibacteria bacterium]|nr:2-succinyl-5-enolpyruvyl-6-hydroxy-3-cyclohexene-1-carboxylic-acid synthase [Ignavibacteria bacterium]
MAASLFAEILLANNIKHVVISPGSRSTPLVLAFSMHPGFNCHPVIDERGAAFFATGLARAAGTPVVLVCTSGTAVAEYYPAIIEAYQQRIPLIVCTADRPEYLWGTGANQTIFQTDIYQNHIRYACSPGLIEPTKTGLRKLRDCTEEAIRVATHTNKGPVHINFQFEKPFEPESFTDTIAASVTTQAFNCKQFTKNKLPGVSQKALKRVFNKLHEAKRPLILVGSSLPLFDEQKAIVQFAKSYGAPIFAEIGSGLRTLPAASTNIISNYDSILRSPSGTLIDQPDLLIIFGRTMTSAALDKFIHNVQAPRIIINEYGDLFDSTKNSRIILSATARTFLEEYSRHDFTVNKTDRNKYRLHLKKLNGKIEGKKSTMFSGKGAIHEPELVNIISNLLPGESNLFIANSMTYRVFDDFASPNNSRITCFHNRGASGIDGLIATTAGIAAGTVKPTFLAVGDTSFYYDLNSLWLLKQKRIPLIIFLFNNNGGRIFDILPVQKYKSILSDYFTMPVSYDIEKVVSSFAGGYFRVDSLEGLDKAYNEAREKDTFSVIDIQYSPEYSREMREQLRG